MAQHKLAEARGEFEAVVKRSPNSVPALTMLGILFQADGDTRSARDRFERVLKIDPDASVAANNLAWIYAESGDNLDVAVDLAQRAHRKLPDVPEVSDTLGFVYYKKGWEAQAITTLSATAGQDPGNAVYQYHLGLAYASAGDVTRAEQSLTRALALKGDFPGAREARDLLASLGHR
jgi:Tfp pilus assembly protein PilF